MSDFLEQVVAERRADIANAKANVPESALIPSGPRQLRLPTHDASGRRKHMFIMDHRGDAFAMALRFGGPVAVIAEVKRRSPALGSLGETLDAASLARTYAEAGATAISVLTEPRYWGGSIEDLVAVREAVEIPILCKDVIVDEYQLVQARAAGADAVLLIAEALDDVSLRRLLERARTLGLGVLVEAHEAAAFGRAVATGASVVGVNARNLRRPNEIDIGRVRQLHSFARPDQILVAESGIESVNDAQLLPARVNAVLIGTALMRADDPGPLIRGIASIHRTVHA
ncbi:MAG: indole-3-glycerol phosphate synthase TrpC [Chloroflexota bacterium]|nr:indole-3-glycerol phosphate synthase TrpC [Chloroflexota bacterium]